MKPPAGLGKAGKRLWADVQAGLPEDWELDERETNLLMLAAGQADDLELLMAAVKSSGAYVTGSQGQPVMNPAIAEARQARLAIARLVGLIGLPDEESDQRETDRTRRARRAARSRWDRKAKVTELRSRNA